MSADDLPTVRVMVRHAGTGGWVARAGRGKKSKSARSIRRATEAAQRAAAKYFGLDACNVQGPADIVLTLLVDGTQGAAFYTATLPARTGGAS